MGQKKPDDQKADKMRIIGWLIGLFLLVCGAAFVLCLALPGDDQSQVKAVFQGYKSALNNANGAEAAKLVDSETKEYYAKAKQLALTASAEVVKQQPFMDRLMIVSLRHRLQTQDLRELSPEKLIEYAVNSGWISKSSVEDLDIGQVTIDGDDAFGELLNQGQRTPLKFRFRKEQGTWHFCLTTLLDAGNAGMIALAKQQEMSEDDLILTLLEKVSGKPVPATIWDKPQRPNHGQVHPTRTPSDKTLDLGSPPF